MALHNVLEGSCWVGYMADHILKDMTIMMNHNSIKNIDTKQSGTVPGERAGVRKKYLML